MRFNTKSEKETRNLASDLAIKWANEKNLIILLKGNLGSGKTVFVKGFLYGHGVDTSIVKSPTYTYMRIYTTPKGKKVYHFDYYRLEKADNATIEELHEIIEYEDSPILIEWPEKIEETLAEKRIEILFEIGDKKDERIININKIK